MPLIVCFRSDVDMVGFAGFKLLQGRNRRLGIGKEVAFRFSIPNDADRSVMDAALDPVTAHL
jgi:hypothetical protein